MVDTKFLVSVKNLTKMHIILDSQCLESIQQVKRLRDKYHSGNKIIHTF